MLAKTTNQVPTKVDYALTFEQDTKAPSIPHSNKYGNYSNLLSFNVSKWKTGTRSDAVICVLTSTKEPVRSVTMLGQTATLASTTPLEIQLVNKLLSGHHMGLLEKGVPAIQPNGTVPSTFGLLFEAQNQVPLSDLRILIVDINHDSSGHSEIGWFKVITPSPQTGSDQSGA